MGRDACKRGVSGLPDAWRDEQRTQAGTEHRPETVGGARGADREDHVTDPDSRNVKTPRGYLQGYNAQAVCNEQQIVIAAEITGDSPDFGHLQPMITASQRELHAAGITDPLEVVVADTGYWHHIQMDELAAQDITVLIPPTPANAPTPDPAGTADATPSCAASCRPISAPRSTPNANS